MLLEALEGRCAIVEPKQNMLHATPDCSLASERVLSGVTKLAASNARRWAPRVQMAEVLDITKIA